MTVVQAIIGVFEDYLEERGIEIPNVEKEGIEGEAIIYRKRRPPLLSYEVVVRLSE